MKRGTPEHPKVSLLMDRLGLPLFAAVGVLECLWHATSKHHPDGNIGRWCDTLIARCVGWNRQPSELIEALVACGWLDTHPDHRLVVHDWLDHCDQATSRRIERWKNHLDLSSQRRTRLDMSSHVQPRLDINSIPEPEPEPEPLKNIHTSSAGCVPPPSVKNRDDDDRRELVQKWKTCRLHLSNCAWSAPSLDFYSKRLKKNLPGVVAEHGLQSLLSAVDLYARDLDARYRQTGRQQSAMQFASFFGSERQGFLNYLQPAPAPAPAPAPEPVEIPPVDDLPFDEPDCPFPEDYRAESQ